MTCAYDVHTVSVENGVAYLMGRDMKTETLCDYQPVTGTREPLDTMAEIAKRHLGWAATLIDAPTGEFYLVSH